MIVYNDIKKNFVSEVRNNTIADKILAEIRQKGFNVGDAEYNSWQNSMQFMGSIVDDNEIDGGVQVAIEYNIPLTSKRVDFIMIGADERKKDHVIIVELKQWSKAEVVDDQMHHSVRSYVAGDNRIVPHPSYQAYSYSRFIYNNCQTVSDENISLIPCAYLHNYHADYKNVLSDKLYKEWYTEAPYFIKGEAKQFSDFIKKYITKKSSKGDLLFLIDGGRLKPAKALQDTLTSLVKGCKEFILLDEQVVCFDMCIKAMDQCKKDGKKRTIVIQGGPGTGKSVLAINLLMEFINKSYNSCYVTKNSAPRNAFLHLLTHSDAKKIVDIKHLFRSPFGLSKADKNTYDCLIVDEAHRLVPQMFRDYSGSNQVKECINASLLTIFMLDEDQAITVHDIGSVDEIKMWTKALNSSLIMRDETVLFSQYRCNGSDAYIQFIDHLLQRGKESININLSELNYDFQVFNDPSEMREALRKKNDNNKARMVAGYCYDWNVKKRRGDYDIILNKGKFKAKWNLEDDNIWAINPNSFDQVGCIHTAQGLEFDYVGVIIGKDLRYDKESNKVITDKTEISKDDHSSGIRNSKEDVARRLILNTYKTLLTRGQKGCYVYCEDDNLRDYIKGLLATQ